MSIHSFGRLNWTKLWTYPVSRHLNSSPEAARRRAEAERLHRATVTYLSRESDAHAYWRDHKAIV